MTTLQTSPVKILGDATNNTNVSQHLLSPTKRARTTYPTESDGSENQKQHQPKPVLKFAKMTEHATTPTRGSKLAAGFDLYR